MSNIYCLTKRSSGSDEDEAFFLISDDADIIKGIPLLRATEVKCKSKEQAQKLFNRIMKMMESLSFKQDKNGIFKFPYDELRCDTLEAMMILIHHMLE